MKDILNPKHEQAHCVSVRAGYAPKKVEDLEKLSSIIVNEGRCGITVEAIKLLKEKQLPVVRNASVGS